MRDEAKKLVKELRALVPPEIIQAKTGGWLWPPRPEQPGQKVPDYAKDVKYTGVPGTGYGIESDPLSAAQLQWILREGVLDYVRAGLDPMVWDQETGKLRPDVKDAILSRMDSGLASLSFNPSWIQQVLIIGSITGRQYRSTSDVDVDVVLGPDAPDEVIKMVVDHFVGRVNGEPVPGTKHPVNFFFTKSLPPMRVIDGMYDLSKDEWVKKPEGPGDNFDPEAANKKAYETGREVADEIVKVFAELKRDVQDLQELKELDSEFADDLQLKKMQEIDEAVLCLSRVSKRLWRERDDAFKKDDEPQKSFANIVYKFVEKSGQIASLHNLIDVRNAYIDNLAIGLGIEEKGKENATP